MDEEVQPVMIPAGEYITIEDAARLAGYSGAGNLRSAAAEGRLKTIKLSARRRMTTKEWLDDYLAGLAAKEGWPRGKPRRRPAEEE